MGFFTRGAKQRDAPSPAAPLRAAAATPPRRPKGSMLEPARADQRDAVLDLDETLVRSSFDTNFDADFEAPFNLNGSWCTARVRKRPFVDEFLARVADKFEVVIMTAGVRPYASLVLDLLDTGRVLGPRFYRESCTKTANGLLVKDLSRMNRDLKRTIIVDNRAAKG
ncbi:phosphoprotein phosphatase [Aureococcus anophagefferens]|nr:phosphoprotein phosphatase [Aureococcus anophagefferens]